jgi:hypothetical protein
MSHAFEYLGNDYQIKEKDKLFEEFLHIRAIADTVKHKKITNEKHGKYKGLCFENIRCDNPDLAEKVGDLIINVGGRLSTYHQGEQREILPDIDAVYSYLKEKINAMEGICLDENSQFSDDSLTSAA